LVAFEIAPKMTWADAMGLVVIEGLIIAVLVLTGLRTAIFHSVPTQLKTAARVVVCAMFVFTLLITDFFDTMGTMVAVGQEGGLVNEDGTVPRTREILLVDSLAAAAGGAASTSSNTSYIESASGVAEGARTGVANLLTGVLFLLAMFLAPLVTIVPFEAAATALVVVGFLMMMGIRNIDWADYEIAIPAFLTIVLMPFTYSISNGIGAGVITYTLIKLVRGKAREVHPLMWGVAALFLLYFLRGVTEIMLG